MLLRFFSPTKSAESDDGMESREILVNPAHVASAMAGHMEVYCGTGTPRLVAVVRIILCCGDEVLVLDPDGSTMDELYEGGR